jgi:hypothetical protein
MQYILMDYVREAGWTELTKAEQENWLGAYRTYMEAMMQAGVLKNSTGLQPPRRRRPCGRQMARRKCWMARMPTRKSSWAAFTSST